jgi:hypothetical protein
MELACTQQVLEGGRLKLVGVGGATAGLTVSSWGSLNAAALWRTLLCGGTAVTRPTSARYVELLLSEFKRPTCPTRLQL